MPFIDPPRYPDPAQRPVIAQSAPQTDTEPRDPQDNTARWFLTQEDAKPAILLPTPTPYLQKNKVTAFINYRDYYGAIAEAIANATTKDHFIYFCDWEFDPDTWVDTPAGRQLLRTLLKDASEKRSVPIRALLWKNTHNILGPKVNNGPHVSWLNSLPTGGAIHDDRYLNFGTHHQKMFIAMGGTNEVTGFCGGMDIAESRQLRDGGKSPPISNLPVGWYDVQVKIEGPAANELWRTFTARWLDQPISNMPTNSTVMRVATAKTAKGGGELDVQVVRTFGNGTSHPWGMPPGIGGLRAYGFAPDGDMTIYKLLCKAIKETKSTIYLEDQYLVESAPIGSFPAIGVVLANTISKASFGKMIILVPGAGSIQGELHQVWRRRINFWQQLGASASKKVAIYAYRADPESPLLVHSKTWIFDDTFAVVSSANSNRRGYSHDSEVGAGIADPNSRGDRLNWAHELRISLWLKHLNKKTPRVIRGDLIDFLKAASYWNPDPHSIIEPLDLTHPSNSPPDEVISPFDTFDDEWNDLLDPEGS